METWDDAQELRSWLGQRRPWLGVDIETTGLNAGSTYGRLCQFGDGGRGFALAYEDWRGLIRELIQGYEGRQVYHNLVYDSTILKADGIEVPQRTAHDTLVMCHLKNAMGAHDLKGAASIYVDKRARAGQSLLRQNFQLQGWGWHNVPIEAPAYWMYSTLDTCLTALLAEALWDETGGGPFAEAYELELAVIHSLRDAELAGLRVDEEYRQAAVAQLSAELAALVEQIPLRNPNSDDQLRAYLQSIGAPLFLKTEAGKLSVDKDVLKWLAPSYPIAGVMREYRQKYKFLNNYMLKLGPVHFISGGRPGQVVAVNNKQHKGLAVDGIIRPKTRPVGALTSRMSVTDPPLQQLPRGRVVRDAIIPREGHCLVMADFAGMEMRGLAADAREAGMLAVFNQGLDVHNETARALYGEAFTKANRTLCKNAGFAKIYGAGIEKFAVTAQIDVAIARDFLMRYDQLYPGVVNYMTAVTKRIYERAGGRQGTGYVVLIDGRQVPVPGEEAYKGVNYRIQGSCAVVTKRKIDELDRAGLGPYFRLAVHDELIYEVPLDLAAQARNVIERVMPDRRSFPGVVLEIESDVVGRWGSHYRDDYPAYIPTADDSYLREAA